MRSEPIMEDFRPFVRNSLLLVGIELASKLLGLAFFIILARYLGAGELGIYAFAMALANFFVIAPRFGFEKVVQREIGRSGKLLKGYFLELTAVKGIISAAAMGALFIALWIASPKHLSTSLVISWFVFAFAYLEFLNSIFRGLQRAEYEVLTRSVFSLLNLSIGLAVLWFGGRLLGVSLGQVASVSAGIMISLFLLRRFIVDSLPDYGWSRLHEHIRKAAPLGGVLIALYFSNQMGVLVLGAMKGESEAGYFAAAMRVFDNFTLIAAAIMGAFLPGASDLYRRSRDAFSDASQSVMKQVFILAAPLGCAMTALAEPITLLLYGSEFSPTVTDLRILGLTLIFSFWNYTADSVLIAADRERTLFRITLCAAVVHVASNLTFVPLHSHAGAALSVAVTQIFYSILLTVQIRGTIHLKRLGALLWKPAVCALGMGWMVYALREIHIVFLIPLGAGVYFVCLFATRALDIRELRSLGYSFHGRALGK